MSNGPSFWRAGAANIPATSARFLDVSIDRGRWRPAASPFNAALRVKGASYHTTPPAWNAKQGGGTDSQQVNANYGGYNRFEGNAGGCWRSLDYMLSVPSTNFDPFFPGFTWPEHWDTLSVQAIVGGLNGIADPANLRGVGLLQGDGAAGGALPGASYGVMVSSGPAQVSITTMSASGANMILYLRPHVHDLARIEIRVTSPVNTGGSTFARPLWEVFIDDMPVYSALGNDFTNGPPAALGAGKCGYQAVAGLFGPMAGAGQYLELYDLRVILAQRRFSRNATAP